MSDGFHIAKAYTIPDVRLIQPQMYWDNRGYFSKVWASNVGLGHYIEDNVSMSRNKHTFRGLHYQAKPFEQAKFIRVLKGSIIDVVVDLRRGLPSFGKSVMFPMHGMDGDTLVVPAGCAHGFLTTTDDAIVLYKMNAPHNPSAARGLNAIDPALNIVLPTSLCMAIMTEKDQNYPFLKDIPEADLFD